MDIVDQQAALAGTSQPGAWNDPDMLEVGNGYLTDDENRAHFSLWALLNAPLIAGNDVRHMSKEVRTILTNTEVIAVDQDWGGRQGSKVRDDGDTEVWAKPMSDGSVAVILLNRGRGPVEIATTADAHRREGRRALHRARPVEAQHRRAATARSRPACRPTRWRCSVYGAMSESHRTGRHTPSLPNVYRVARRVLAAVLVSGLVAAVPASKPLPLPALARLPDDGLARTPPMGWNSWNHFAGRITAADVRAMADAMVANGMRDAGYTYVNIDDTWEGERDAAGHLQTNAKFGDMKALADYIHARGLKLGIYSSPGAKTCAGFVGSYGHESDDAHSFAAWGVDYLKYDYCGARDIYPLTQANQQALFQAMGAALREDWPADRLQPLPVGRIRDLAMGQADRRPSMAHHAGHQ